MIIISSNKNLHKLWNDLLSNLSKFFSLQHWTVPLQLNQFIFCVCGSYCDLWGSSQLTRAKYSQWLQSTAVVTINVFSKIPGSCSPHSQYWRRSKVPSPFQLGDFWNEDIHRGMWSPRYQPQFFVLVSPFYIWLDRYETVPWPLNGPEDAFGVHAVVCCPPDFPPNGTVAFSPDTISGIGGTFDYDQVGGKR